MPQGELDLDETAYEREIRDFWRAEALDERKGVDDQIKKDNEKAKGIAKQKEAEAKNAEEADKADGKAK